MKAETNNLMLPRCTLIYCKKGFSGVHNLTNLLAETQTGLQETFLETTLGSETWCQRQELKSY